MKNQSPEPSPSLSEDREEKLKDALKKVNVKYDKALLNHYQALPSDRESHKSYFEFVLTEFSPQGNRGKLARRKCDGEMI